MIGLDSYSATKESFVGIDWLNLASGALKTAGGAMSSFEGGDKSGGASSSAEVQAMKAAQAAAEKARLEDQKRAAEQSAAAWKLVGVVGLVVVIFGSVLLFRHPTPAHR